MKRKNKKHAIAKPYIPEEARQLLRYESKDRPIPWFDANESKKYWEDYFQGRNMLD